MFIIDKTVPLSKIAESLIVGEDNFLANISNVSALIYNYLPDLNWAGFYMLSGDELILSAFQGLPACIRIKVGRGVCGACAEGKTSIIVDDVESFPGHIACDSASKSELVVPLMYNNSFIGLIDLDSPINNRFNAEIQSEIELIAKLIVHHSDCDKIIAYYNQKFPFAFRIE